MAKGQYNDNGWKNLEAAAAMAPWVLVNLNASNGKADLAGAGDQETLGSTADRVEAAGDNVAVRLWSHPGTRLLTAALAITRGDKLYPAASGRVTNVANYSGEEPLGSALEAASGAGVFFEVAPLPFTAIGGGDNHISVVGGAGGIAAGDIVYVSAVASGVATVLKAQGTAAGIDGSYYAPLAIAAAATGKVYKRYIGTGLNTSAGAIGDDVWLSDGTAGGWTLTKPTATDDPQIVGKIASVHATTGAIDFDLSGFAMIEHDHSTAAEGSNIAASSVTIADAGGHTAQTETEAALQELYQDLLSIQNVIQIPIDSWKETTNFDVGNIAVNGGLLASDTTPVRDAIDAATDGCQRLLWASSNNDQVTAQVVLPPDIDTAKDLVLHLRIVSGGTTDAVGFTVDTFFNEGDTKVVDTSGTNQTTTYAEVTATIAAADIPAGAQTITIGLTPVAHTTDTLALTAAWLEYARVIKTS